MHDRHVVVAIAGLRLSLSVGAIVAPDKTAATFG
jgi:hypothetical protein